jgi:hypothetical protein
MIQNIHDQHFGENGENIRTGKDVIAIGLGSAQCEDKVFRILHMMCRFSLTWLQQTD